MILALFTTGPALACEAPSLFETDPSLTGLDLPDPLGVVEVVYGRGPHPNDPSCTADQSWMEIQVDVPADVGVRVETEATQSAGAPDLGSLQRGVYAADEPIVLFWDESADEARETLHYTLWLTPVNAAGEDGPIGEWEGYSEVRLAEEEEDEPDEVLPITLCSTAAAPSFWSTMFMRH